MASFPIIESQRGAVDRKAPYEQMGVALRGVAPLSENTELQASLRGFTDERDRGFDFSDNQNSGVDASLRLVNRATPDGWQWSALGYLLIPRFCLALRRHRGWPRQRCAGARPI